MNRQPDKLEADVTMDARLWTQSRAEKAVPYLRTVMRSLREYWLESRQAEVQLERMNSHSGRRDRQSLMLHDEIVRNEELARTRFDEALSEFEALNVRCIDVVRGLALLPFSRVDELAWFVFDLFAPEGLVGWRFESDPASIRRNLRNRIHEPSTPLHEKNVDLLMSRKGTVNDPHWHRQEK